MAVLVALTVGLIFWIVAWTLGLMKAFDAFMVVVVLVVMATTVRVAAPFVRRQLGRE